MSVAAETPITSTLGVLSSRYSCIQVHCNSVIVPVFVHANTFIAWYICAGDASLANGDTMKLQRPLLARHQWALGRLAELRRCLQLTFTLACLILCNKLVPTCLLTNHNQLLWVFDLENLFCLQGLCSGCKALLGLPASVRR